MVAKSPARQTALKRGKRRYFTGLPCKRGHIAERLVSTYVCLECAKIQNRIWAIANRRKVALTKHQWWRANKEKVALGSRQWRRAHRGVMNAENARRRAQKLKATPSWLTEAQWRAIRKVYELAAQKGLTVDHVIPLQNERVCGLHVPWNLQLLSKEQNSKKGNTF